MGCELSCFTAVDRNTVEVAFISEGDGSSIGRDGWVAHPERMVFCAAESAAESRATEKINFFICVCFMFQYALYKSLLLQELECCFLLLTDAKVVIFCDI